MDTIQYFFMSMGIFSTASFLSALIVAKYIWKPMKDKKTTFPPSPFFCKYAYLLYDDDDTEEYENLEDMMQNVIMEHTPEGPVFIRYNHEKKSFDYWSNETIKYIHLNTVAKKYVIMYQCKNAYIPTETEQLKDPSKNSINSVFYVRKQIAKKIIMKGNKFNHVGKCYDAPFFEKQEKTPPFFCGGNVTGLNYKSFKKTFLKNN